jgi:hypothetical protein
VLVILSDSLFSAHRFRKLHRDTLAFENRSHYYEGTFSTALEPQ